MFSWLVWLGFFPVFCSSDDILSIEALETPEQ